MRNQWRKAVLGLGVVLFLSGCGKAQESYNEGMKLAEEGKYEKSLPYFQKAIQESDDQAEYYIGYGMALNRLKRYEEAKTEFKKVLQETDNKISKENNKQLYYGLAIAEYNLGEYDEVAAYCEKALKIEYLEDMDGDILYTRMMAYFRLGEWKKAKKDCERILQKDKGYMDAYLSLAYLENRLGDHEKAVETYLAAIEEDEEYYDAYFALYEEYQASGQEEAAKELLGQLCALKTNKAENMLVVGRAYLYMKEYDQAEKYLKMADTGNSTESRYFLGMLYAEQGKYADAEEEFQTYLKENEKDFKVEAYYQLAQLYMEQDKYDKAQEALKKGLACGGSSVVQALEKLQVILYEKQNQYQKALSFGKEYQKRYPLDAGMEKEIAFIKTRIK